MEQVVKKSIAVVGEGKTEWFYFESMRVYLRLPLKMAPSIPQHSDVGHIIKLVRSHLRAQYDYVVCLFDMDRLLGNPVEMEKYRQAKKKFETAYPGRILFVETNPCTEYWFLLHFLREAPLKEYDSFGQILPELGKYMPGYEKTEKYFRKTNLYKYLVEHGDLAMAVRNAERLCETVGQSPGDCRAYSEIYKVIRLLNQLRQDSL